MQITDTTIVSIPLSQLVCNEGQIDGVPANPRILRDDKYRALVESLRADNLTGINPLKVYAQGDLFVVLGGNMRLRALQEIGAAECPCIEIPQDTPTEVLRKIVVLDNSTFGEWDWDMLANEWDDAELKEWGLDVPTAKEKEEQPDLSDTINAAYKVEVSCTCEEDQEKLYNDLTTQGYQCRLLTL